MDVLEPSGDPEGGGTDDLTGQNSFHKMQFCKCKICLFKSTLKLYIQICWEFKSKVCLCLGQKKSRLKSLKSRLFGKIKRKDGDGSMKQTHSESDITLGVKDSQHEQ